MRNTKILLLAVALCAATAFAKLPPPSEEAKAKAAEAAAKTAWSDKVANFQFCKAQDKVAARYRATMKQAGKVVPAAASAPAPCADPGAYVAAASAVKPLEAAEAHSPAETATKPPSTKQPQAQTKGTHPK